MDNFDLRKYINEGRIHSPINLNENLESQAISILKKYKNEIGEVGKYIEYLNNIPSNDDVHSAIQAIADDLDRDNYIEDDLRVELEKLSLAEGKLKEGMSLKFYDEDVELNADSGDYIAFIEDDGTVSFSVIDEDVQDEYEDGFDEDNWKDYLGPKHAFVQISNQIPTKVEADRDYVMITVDLEDLKNLVK